MTSTRYLLLMFMFSLVGHHQWDGLELAWHVKLIHYTTYCTILYCTVLYYNVLYYATYCAWHVKLRAITFASYRTIAMYDVLYDH